MKKTSTPTNKPTAELRIKILQFVMEEDFYPKEWFMVNDLEKLFMADAITYEQYDKEIKELLEGFNQYVSLVK